MSRSSFPSRLAAAVTLAYAFSGCAPAAPPAASPATTSARAGAPSAEGTLVVLGTTDTHGWLLPHDYFTGKPTENGLTLLAPLIDSIRAANEGRTLLLDSGDLLQGTPLDLVYAKLQPGETHPVAAAMNALGYDASAIGNHEFNYGIEHLNRVTEQAKFPFVAANVFRAGTDEHAYRPYLIVERTVGGEPVRIGITGVTPPGVAIWDRDNVKGRLDFRDIVASVRPVVAEMRRQGADLVIVAAHSGLEGSSYDPAVTGVPIENAAAAMAREIPGIDLILMGHTHRELADTTIAGTLVMQAKNWATSLAVAELRLARAPGGEWKVVSKHGSLLRPAPGRASPALSAVLAAADARTKEYVSRTIGTSTAEWSSRASRVEDTPIMDLINEVQRKAAGADLSGAAAFSLTSRFPKGPVTVANVAGLYIYDNTLKALRISGAQLRQYLERSAEYYLPCPAARCARLVNPEVPGYNFDVVSGVDYALDLTRPAGERVVKLERKGKAVAPTDSFTIALNNYRASGSGGFSMFAGAPVVYDRGESIRDLLIAEVRRRGTVDPADFFHRNWEIEPASLREQALAEEAPRAAPGGELHGGKVVADTAGAKHLRVLATNDFHGALEAARPGFARGREVGGAAAIEAYFERERAGAGPTILIDAGDVMQGTPLSNLTRGRASVDFYNRAGYAAAAVGNHEFDWSIATLRERMEQARFAWLGANIYLKGTDTLPSWIQPTAMIPVVSCASGGTRCDTVRVGVIGIATEATPTTTKPSNVTTLTFGDEAEAVERWVPRLRAAGADFVVVTAHSGAFCDRDDPSKNCQGEIVDVANRLHAKPDLIVSGHTHSQVNTVVNGIPIVQGNSSGTRFSVVDLTRTRNGAVTAKVVAQPTTYVDEVRPDSAIAAMIERYRVEIGPKVNEVITLLAAPLTREGGEYPLGDLIVDAQRAATGTQVAITNNGGIRTELAAGPVRWSDLFRLQPFANTLVTMTVTGAQLLATVERGVAGSEARVHVSGMKVRYRPGAAPGARIVSATLDDGTPITPQGRYTLTVNDFMAEGGDGFEALKQGTEVDRTGTVDLDALVDYLRARPKPLQPPVANRLTREP
jgi:2',3'-cyclic-nucleotide 2'-phosphodiesterase/3'-nucleotidase/5'-nucleotidase